MYLVASPVLLEEFETLAETRCSALLFRHLRNCWTRNGLARVLDLSSPQVDVDTNLLPLNMIRRDCLTARGAASAKLHKFQQFPSQMKSERLSILITTPVVKLQTLSLQTRRRFMTECVVNLNLNFTAATARGLISNTSKLMSFVSDANVAQKMCNREANLKTFSTLWQSERSR